ncbi:hypothetical protein ACFX2K_007453 [Malus domestica]
MEQPTAATQQKVLNAGQHQGVFDRLGLKCRWKRHLQSDGASISMLRFMTKIITYAILAARNHRRAKNLSNLPNLETSVGIRIILQKVSTLHCPNPRNIGTKE